MELYFDAKKPEPDIRITTTRLNLPIYRIQQSQKIEKFINNHPNALTILTVIGSIISNIILISAYIPNININTSLSSAIEILLLLGISLFILLVVLFKKRKIEEKINIDFNEM